jgi:hypothetical protein
MPAYITVTNYGRDTHVHCRTCDLDTQYARHKPAAEAAHQHNDDHHRQEPTP